MNEHLNRFFGITEKDIDETNNIKYSNDDETSIDSDSDAKSLPEEKPKKINKSKTSTK